MPPKPRWLKKVAQIRATAEAAPVGYFDRAAVESLFSLRARQAQKLMARLPTHLLGNGFVVPREAMVAFLRATEHGQVYRAEQLRLAHVRDAVEEVKRDIAARKVRWSVSPAPPRAVADLPDTVRLAPGELTISCSGAEDLLRQLFLLSKAVARDFDRFEAVVRRDPVIASPE